MTSLSIEDAPGPMALHSFGTQVKDGKILVTANPPSTLRSNLSRQPKLLATGANSSGKGVVIVGGGSGAFNTVESLREVSWIYLRNFYFPQTSAFSMDTLVRSPFSRKRIIRPSIGRSSTMLNKMVY